MEDLMAEMQDVFEVAIVWRHGAIERLEDWPASARAATDGAVQRLLMKHPGRSVASERVYRVARGDERFPENVPPDVDCMMVRKVRLDQPVAVEAWA